MNTKKGYVIPIILIVILIMLAGVFVFSQKQAESPVIETPIREEVFIEDVKKEDLKKDESETEEEVSGLIDEDPQLEDLEIEINNSIILE